MIISFLQEKGGAGKTTIAINVACALRKMNKTVLLVDSDVQGSARDWHTHNDGAALDVIGLDRPTIDRDVQKFVKDYDFIIIDGAPRLSTLIAKTIIASDLVLIPVQPSPYDIQASESVVNLVKQRQVIANCKPLAAFIISRRIVGTKIGLEIKDALMEYDLPILENGTYQRVIYAESAALGKSVTDYNCWAAEEIMSIANEIMEICKCL